MFESHAFVSMHLSCFAGTALSVAANLYTSKWVRCMLRSLTPPSCHRQAVFFLAAAAAAAAAGMMSPFIVCAPISIQLSVWPLMVCSESLQSSCRPDNNLTRKGTQSTFTFIPAAAAAMVYHCLHTHLNSMVCLALDSMQRKLAVELQATR